jgi:hypothetical protein
MLPPEADKLANNYNITCNLALRNLKCKKMKQGLTMPGGIKDDF